MASTTPSAVPVTGPPADLSELEGEWRGEYDEVAQGQVWLRPRRWGASENQPYDPITTHSAQVLNIRFVAVEGGWVRATLEPHQDSDTGALLLTAFQGRLEDGTIRGIFTTEHEDTGELEHGHWTAARKK